MAQFFKLETILSLAANPMVAEAVIDAHHCEGEQYEVGSSAWAVSLEAAIKVVDTAKNRNEVVKVSTCNGPCNGVIIGKFVMIEDF